MSLGKFRTVNISSSVNCIAEDYAGYVWLGTDNGLLCYYKGKYVENELTKMCKIWQNRCNGGLPKWLKGTVC